MRRITPIVVAALCTWGVGCGDDSPSGETTGASSSTSTTNETETTGTTVASTGTTSEGSSSSGADTTTGASTTEADTTAGSSSGGSSSGDSGTTDGGMELLDVSIDTLMIFQDCMPIVPPDPVNAFFTLTLTNVGDVPALASVVSATFVNNGGMAVGTIDLTPTDIGPVPVGDTTMTGMSKVAGSLLPANGCGVVLCNEQYTLEVEFEVGDAMVLASTDAFVDCVF